MGNHEPISIGMPVFNGERFISRAIESIRAQTDPNWTLHISDNASTDSTADICRYYEDLDARIKTTRQYSNIGPLKNFRFLIDGVETEYFMWAAADDIWHQDFLVAARAALDKNRNTGMFFCNICNIDSRDIPRRNYPSFSKFVVTDRAATVVRYLLDPEILGKANLFYSVFRISAVLDFILSFLHSSVASNYGSDMALILGVLCRTNLAVDERLLFYKRLSESGNALGKRTLQLRLPHVFGNVKENRIMEYESAVATAVEATDLEPTVRQILSYRHFLAGEVNVLQRSFIIKIFDRLGTKKSKYSSILKQ